MGEHQTNPEYGTRFNQTVTIGRIVHYVRWDGQTRAAVVVRNYCDIVEGDPNSGMSNLRIMTDGANDAGHKDWQGSVIYDESGKTHTWHWPPRV